MDFFRFDSRLGIQIPDLIDQWDQLSTEAREVILFQWEKIRGSIPDRIADIEDEINKKQNALSNEGDFATSCKLNSEIADLASVINDLWLWYRTNQDIAAKTHM